VNTALIIGAVVALPTPRVANPPKPGRLKPCDTLQIVTQASIVIWRRRLIRSSAIRAASEPN
jgi:hypothetical protein